MFVRIFVPKGGGVANLDSIVVSGKRMRKPVHRRTVDYSSTVVRYIQVLTQQTIDPGSLLFV